MVLRFCPRRPWCLCEDADLDLTVFIADLSPGLSAISRLSAGPLGDVPLVGASFDDVPECLGVLTFLGLTALMRVFLLVISALVGGPVESGSWMLT